MSNDTIIPFRKPDEFEDPLTEMLRTGARQLIAQAVEAELAGFLAEHEGWTDEQGRRQILRNGYLLRKLNQAYFAFYGAYADVPGGAAGEDPVGPAVRALRERSTSLADFIHRIARMNSFEDLQAALAAP